MSDICKYRYGRPGAGKCSKNHSPCAGSLIEDQSKCKFLKDQSSGVRTFDTGANRDSDEGKYDYEAFFSPLVIERYGEYMHGKRHLNDGTLRDGDNWQKGIPKKEYIKSLIRHTVDFWLHHRKWVFKEDMEVLLCAILFNSMGYLHELLKMKGEDSGY